MLGTTEIGGLPRGESPVKRSPPALSVLGAQRGETKTVSWGVWVNWGGCCCSFGVFVYVCLLEINDEVLIYVSFVCFWGCQTF